MRNIFRVVLSFVVVTIVAPAGWSAVTAYSQDFEGMAPPSPGALLGDNWLVFANVYDPGGTYLYGYGSFPAPNDGAAFCAIATGQGGPPQGDQQLSVYSDYNNPDHGAGYLIETNVFQEQTIAAADAGTTVVFTFDAKYGNLEGASEAEAFIKTLNPGAGYATTNHVTIDMTTVPPSWGTYSIQLAIDSGLVGQILQFGFTTRASNYEGSGIYYDNVNSEAALFADGFESGDLSAWSGVGPDGGSFGGRNATRFSASLPDRGRSFGPDRARSQINVQAGFSVERAGDATPSRRAARPPSTVVR